MAGPNAAGRRERFRWNRGDVDRRNLGMGFATTGFSAEQARRGVHAGGGAHPKAARGRELLRRRKHRGGAGPWPIEAAVGGRVGDGKDESSGRINVIASALQSRMKVEEFESLDLAYSPPFATGDPLLDRRTAVSETILRRRI